VLRDRENRDTPSPARNIEGNSRAGSNTATPSQSSGTSPGADKRWLLRFQELETRLKAEQEGRALDQKGAKLRLDEVRKENAELKNEIIKEKEGSVAGSSTLSTRLSKEKVGDGSGA
jgi:Micro-tubular organiser Mto1 C-term Mto2-binding region